MSGNHYRLSNHQMDVAFYVVFEGHIQYNSPYTIQSYKTT